MHNYTTYEEHVRYVELPQHEHENHHHDKEGTASDVLEPKKRKRKQQPAMKKALRSPAFGGREITCHDAARSHSRYRATNTE
ncbi:hypothetical protein LNO78_28280 [Klebsiella pneumoniae subsp. pneumoniae]|nr:hypothetical protein [Klebsiella variicola subsp. variicola]MCS5982163.1 hypothetical protein [Klebsiella pneumoniae subsp. pneumoniae]